jgi:hypothetical protein
VHRAAAVAVACLAGVVGHAAAQARPRLEVTLRERADGPPDAVVMLRGLLADDRFLSAMRSGFPLYMAYQVELRESRSMWDRTVARDALELVVLYDPGRDVYQLEDERGTEEIRDRAVLERRLASTYVFEGLRPDGPGRFHYRGSVTARTLSDEDVDEVFAWLKGESEGAPHRPGLVTRTARKLLIQVAPLPRITVEARSAEFAGR